MLSLPDQAYSYWMNVAEKPTYPSLTHDIETDVVVVGAGIAGLTSAYLLKQRGLKVVVLEKDEIGAGVSGHTTGKITSQHNLIYNKLASRLGQKTARAYGVANQAALKEIATIIKRETIDCDFRKADNYVYTTDASKIAQFKQEAETAKKCGLPASFETTSELPFEIAAAVRFSDQATFHIRNYLVGLARAVDGGGSHVFEHSYVMGIRDGAPTRVKTTKAKVFAKDCIVATNVPTFPLLARGTYCAMEYPQRSYIVAGENQTKLKHMYISPDKHNYSLLPVSAGDDELLLIGGEGHLPGTRLNADKRYQPLADYGEQHFNMKKIAYKWNARDYLGYDDMPLIGRLYPWSKHTYTATGFMKWGITNGTVAGMVLSDLITKGDNKWADMFSPQRLSAVTSIPKVVGENLG